LYNFRFRKYLDSHANGKDVILYDKDVQHGTEWNVVDKGGGYFQLVNRRFDMYLDSHANGKEVMLFDKDVQHGTEWKVVTNGKGNDVTNGVQLVNRRFSKYLDSHANGKEVMLFDKDVQNGTVWVVSPAKGFSPTPPTAAMSRATVSGEVAAVAPKECVAMVGFNHSSAGAEAVKLTKYLCTNGIKTFCTDVWCPHGQAGRDWQQATVEGVATSKYFIPLMTHGWQKSKECQDETNMAYQRYKHEGVVIIPVKFADFSETFDKSSSQHWSLKFQSVQQVFHAENPKWMDMIKQSIA